MPTNHVPGVSFHLPSYQESAPPPYPETKSELSPYGYGLDSSVDSNYHRHIFDASSSNLSDIKMLDSDYRYISDPATGLTALFDTSQFDVDEINIRELGLSIPEAKNFKAMALHVTPKDDSQSFVQILMHNKSGTNESDQKARDSETELLSKISAKIRERYPFTHLHRFQGDINISAFAPKNPKDTSVAYLTNPSNYSINKPGLNNFLTRLTPPGAILTDFSAATPGLKERSENMLDCAQCTKLGYREGASKAVCVQIEFSPFVLTQAAITAQQNDLIDKIPLPSPSEAIQQFGINVYDSDHRPTRPQTKNGHTFVTAALINTFGPMGFQNEKDLILADKNTPQDKERREKLKVDWTTKLFSLILSELSKKGADISSLNHQATLIEASKFILKHEWVLMNATTLNTILKQIKQFPETVELNTHCFSSRAILGTDHKIEDCLKRIFNKNYKISLVPSSKPLTDPSKDELINCQIENNIVSYVLRNHNSEIFKGQFPFASVSPKLSQEEEERLKVDIIKAVNWANKRPMGQKPAAVKGSQLLNNLSDNCDWQLYAGFPYSGKMEAWKPMEDQRRALCRLVREQDIGFFALTECSSKKHLDINNVNDQKEARQRDREDYPTIWAGNMFILCDALNDAALQRKRRLQAITPATADTARLISFAFTPFTGSSSSSSSSGVAPLASQPSSLQSGGKNPCH